MESRAYARMRPHPSFLLLFFFFQEIYTTVYISFLLFVYQMRSLLPFLRRKSEDKAINVALIHINAEEITINAEEIIC